MPTPGAGYKKASQPGVPQGSDSGTILDVAGELDNELMELKAKYDQYKSLHNPCP